MKSCEDGKSGKFYQILPLLLNHETLASCVNDKSSVGHCPKRTNRDRVCVCK